ncbi:hypothetical protein BFN03_14525 [Rhodococcus sp. WMMA185]|uniref:lipoprotein LpqV n=1 Tax=Rhodococcus sp. WMMA185 TaxID=679318 RepID=UPI000878788F|nr:lipoprotein LpqV [Rhodococcus sp. WMMA185]AOW93454.1 hypothetical protein BFN03_14525 [Rhodococcus sp. WMMA185]
MKRTLLTLVAPATLLLAGCSSGESADMAAPSSTPVAATTTESVTATVDPSEETTSIYEVSENGVTTAVNAPITASSEELAQWCSEAKMALEMYGFDDAESFLAIAQLEVEDSTENVTFESDGSWASNTPSEQAGFIASVNAAANGEC